MAGPDDRHPHRRRTRLPRDGEAFGTVSANLGLFRNGKAVEHWSEQGMFPMLVQIGVLPMPAPAVPSQRGATAGAGAAAPAWYCLEVRLPAPSPQPER